MTPGDKAMEEYASKSYPAN